MLRITRLNEGTDTLCLKVEGRLVGSWVGVLEQELTTGEGALPHVVLDLSRVDFANLSGAALLRAAAERGVELTGCSPLLSSLIETSAP